MFTSKNMKPSKFVKSYVEKTVDCVVGDAIT